MTRDEVIAKLKPLESIDDVCTCGQRRDGCMHLGVADRGRQPHTFRLNISRHYLSKVEARRSPTFSSELDQRLSIAISRGSVPEVHALILEIVAGIAMPHQQAERSASPYDLEAVHRQSREARR